MINLITSWSNILNFLGFTFYLRFTNVFIYCSWRTSHFKLWILQWKYLWFLDHYLQPTAENVKLFMKDTNHFLRKICSLGQLSGGAILRTIDVAGLYPNIPVTTENFVETLVFGVLLIDLSKAFDCVSDDLWITKQNAYGLSVSALKLVHSYIHNHQQRTKFASS